MEFAERFRHTWQMQTDLQALAEQVKRRMASLGITVEELTERGGPSDTTMTKVFGARPPAPRSDTVRKLETGLDWAPGSVAAVLAGGIPTPTPVEPPEAGTHSTRLDQARATLGRMRAVHRQLADFSALDLLYELEDRVIASDRELQRTRALLSDLVARADESRGAPGSGDPEEERRRVAGWIANDPATVSRRDMPEHGPVSEGGGTSTKGNHDGAGKKRRA